MRHSLSGSKTLWADRKVVKQYRLSQKSFSQTYNTFSNGKFATCHVHVLKCLPDIGYL